MKNYKLSVPAPCHQNWNNMTPVDQGRYCGSCQKNVIDFTEMSTGEIADVMLSAKGSTCGRFRHEQLEKIIIEVPNQLLFSQTNSRYIFMLALLLSMGTTLLSCTNHRGENKKIDAVTIVDTSGNAVNSTGELPEEIQSTPEKIERGESLPTHTTGVVIVEPVDPAPPSIMGDVVYLPDSLVPKVIEVDAPKAVPNRNDANEKLKN